MMELFLQKNNLVTIIGAGLAGCEAAYQLAKRGIKVNIIEMKPYNMSPAHKSSNLAEIVCSNSFKSDSLDTSHGLLKAELLQLGSLLINTAIKHRVPAGGSLAFNRDDFSNNITEIISSHKNINLIREEAISLNYETPLIIAAGPLISDKLAHAVTEICSNRLFFYDAIAPIIEADSINMEKCFFKSRYDKGDSDYLNCPLTKEQFEIFYEELVKAETVQFKDFEKAFFFEGCMPIEEIASRGKQTLTFGPMKPVGLEHPVTGEKYFAVIQLRKENTEATAYNIVGFQTKMKIEEQKRIFRLISGLEKCEFLRYGSIHRNTYIESPSILEKNYKVKNRDIYFAGQISGVEGYVESIASGLTTAMDIYYKLNDKELSLPEHTAINALSNHVLTPVDGRFTPTNFHFGLLQPLDKKIRDKKLKKKIMSERSISNLNEFLQKSIWI